MGRPSKLRVSARRAADGVRASVGGGCVPVFRGEVSL
jgi:trans-2,3-dihydro-3-hydroxyanthranilate isomerase